ncbi:PIR Superfamily Protein [Plasmodium malariae]|uniref:PIR Superfamily Protein n=1 Tax=Plasmodium malariae TaxID=5858 RepID=A0A1A8X9C2_PLAMA|nr:PIR Superfamily Protein [Plasmodium malariae]
MTSVSSGENENSVTLYLKYKQEFNSVLSDIRNAHRQGGENPGRKCNKIAQGDFIEPCQQIGRYLIEIKELYKSDHLGRCNYLNYRINSDVNYSKNPGWFEKYNIFSSQLDNICENYIKKIEPDILNKLKELYSLYEDFNSFKVQNYQIKGGSCDKIKDCHKFYVDNYKDCVGKERNPFCKELNNFKKAYANKMRDVTARVNVPQFLPPEKMDYVFVSSLTTDIVLLATFTLFIFYKFTPM